MPTINISVPYELWERLEEKRKEIENLLLLSHKYKKKVPMHKAIEWFMNGSTITEIESQTRGPI